jgi:acyl carrier protein
LQSKKLAAAAHCHAAVENKGDARYMDDHQTTTLVKDVQALLVEALRISAEQATPDLSFGDLPQWDSMGHMEVMLLLEQRYDVEINADTIAALTSVPAISAYLQEKDHA